MKIERKLYLNKIIESKQDGLIKIVTGIRRSGKSYLLFVLFYEYLLSIGVDDKRIIRFAFKAMSFASFKLRITCIPILSMS